MMTNKPPGAREQTLFCAKLKPRPNSLRQSADWLEIRNLSPTKTDISELGGDERGDPVIARADYSGRTVSFFLLLRIDNRSDLVELWTSAFIFADAAAMPATSCVAVAGSFH